MTRHMNYGIIIHVAFGPVAQLGERSVRIREVDGSIPFRSTKIIAGHLEWPAIFLFKTLSDQILIPYNNKFEQKIIGVRYNKQEAGVFLSICFLFIYPLI